MSDKETTVPEVPAGTRLILASVDLLDVFGTRTERGERITAEWGEPKPEGWYEPVFTAHADDRLPDFRDAAVALLLAVDTALMDAFIESEDGAEEPAWVDRLHEAADIARAVVG